LHRSSLSPSRNRAFSGIRQTPGRGHLAFLDREGTALALSLCWARGSIQPFLTLLGNGEAGPSRDRGGDVEFPPSRPAGLYVLEVGEESLNKAIHSLIPLGFCGPVVRDQNGSHRYSLDRRVFRHEFRIVNSGYGRSVII